MNSMQQEVSNPRMQAESLKRMGRGPDTQLIHMTDSEIGALNGLSGLVFNEPLRTNPETGLPEAGMFKRLLPTILAIGAGAFLGPAAAGLFAGGAAPGALAMGVGTGLAAGAGHLAGQAVTGQDLDFGRALLAGAGSGLTAGLTFDPAAAAGAGTTVAGDYELAGAAAPSFNPATMVDAGTAASASSADTFNAMADASSNASFGGGFGGYEMGGSQQMLADLGSANPFPVTTDSSLLAGELSAGSTGYIPSPMPDPVPMTRGEQFLSDIRSPGEVYDYIAAEPMKRAVLPLGMAALSGELDEPLPEAPSGPSRTPFTPKDFDFTRSRRDLDRDEDGEVTQADILEVVQELPEGQSSRFYTPGVFTENEELNAKAGGLLRLQTGGNIQEAIGALTGGGGASMLPMIAQSVVKPEDEEEESISKGYPVGKAGTAPGAATTGMAIGGGQPPQPFQEGGPTALELALSDGTGAGGFGTGLGGTAPSSSTTEADTGFGFGIGQGTNSGVDAANAANTAASVAGLGLGVPGLGQAASGIAQAGQYAAIPEAQRGSLQFQPLSLFGLAPTIGQQHTNLTTQRELDIGLAEAEEAEAQESFNAAMGLASLAMAEEDAPEDVGQEAVEEAAAAAAAIGHAADIGISGGGSGPGGGGESTGGGHDLGGGGAFGGDDTGPDGPDGSGSGGADAGDSAGDDGPGGTGGADDYEQGGYLGGASGRAYGGLLQLAGGGSVPYFEGRVMPTGNMTEDGMSDNIPFVIAGRQEGGQMGMQPAVLSPDEYVIPADVVSMLGNGSSTAGANDLDQFINNFRMDKYGRPKQPPEMSGGLSSLA